MGWGKFDDRYDDNRKIKRAWKAHPRAVGLHAMAVTYCCRHETDGAVDIDWLEEKLPEPEERSQVIGALVRLQLFLPDEDGEGFVVNDFLEYNPSSEELEEQRRQRVEAGRKGGQAGRKKGRKGTPENGDRRRVEAAA